MRTLANLVLLYCATVVAVLLVYGLVTVAKLWAASNRIALSLPQEIGITVLFLALALLLLGKVYSNLPFRKARLRLSPHQLNSIANSLSVFHPINQLLELPALVEYAIFEDRLRECCTNLDAARQGTAWKREKLKELVRSILGKKARYQDYTTLGLAHLSARYGWLTKPTNRLLIAIADANEPGAAGQILQHIRIHGLEFESVAVLKHKFECSRRNLDWRADSKNIDRLKPQRSRERQTQDYLSDYHLQQQINAGAV